jgi:hypothetical protein
MQSRMQKVESRGNGGSALGVRNGTALRFDGVLSLFPERGSGRSHLRALDLQADGPRVSTAASRRGETRTARGNIHRVGRKRSRKGGLPAPFRSAARSDVTDRIGRGEPSEFRTLQNVVARGLSSARRLFSGSNWLAAPGSVAGAAQSQRRSPRCWVRPRGAGGQPG